MDTALKQRLWGAAVLAALAIIFLPMLLKSPDVKTPDAAQVPLDMPASPDGKFETRELPLAEPSTSTPQDGVLGMPTQLAPAAADAGIGAASSVAAPAPAPMVPAGSAATTPATAAVPAVPTPPPATVKPVAAIKAPPAIASAPAPAPIAPSTPATAAGSYAVTVGSFGNLANANALVARLRAARLPVMTDKVSVNGGTAMRIRIGPFADRAAAEAARLRTDGVSGGGGKVVAMDAAPSAAPPASTAAPAGAKALAAAAPTPAAAASGFAVQLSAPANEADALALRDRARAQGLNCFVQRVETEQGARFRVRVGPVADRSAAETLRATAQQKLGIAGNIVTHP